MSEDLRQLVNKVERKYPFADFKIKAEPLSDAVVAGTVIYNLAIIASVTYLSVEVSLWALLGLAFCSGSSTDYTLEVNQDVEKWEERLDELSNKQQET